MAVAIAFLALPFLSSTAVAGEPGVCDTNQGTGKVDSFTQNTEPDGSGQWVNGNLNKSDYKEGDWVPQRIAMSQLQPGENELAFTYMVYKKVQGQKKWAYDKDRFEGFTGATLTRWNAEVTEDSSGTGTATVYVTFDVPAGSQKATLYYDLHIASELDHGAGSGAASIKGSSYHGGMLSLNCKSSGQNANQIDASSVAAGLLTVAKAATPADGTDFHFSITPGGEASTFDLDVDNDATLPDRLTYRVPPGTYTVEELNLPDGWNLTDVTCSKAPSASTPTSRAVDIADDEQVTCTFSNAKVTRKDLGVTATATPAYHRDYDWTVDKSLVGPPTRKIAEGGSADVDYSVVVTPSAPEDSHFEVSGRISVTNPNNVPVAGVSIEDSIPGATCTVLDGGTEVTGPVTVPVGGKDFTYTCAMGADTKADTAGTATVNLTWSAADYYQTTGAAAASAGFDFATAKPTVTDDTVTVTDSAHDLSAYDGGNVVHATDGPRTFTYTVTWPGEPGACKSYGNTATVTEEDGDKQSDGTSVEVCEGKDLTVAKTVVHDYYRTYAWSLGKSVVGAATKEADANGTATFDYKVTATAGPASDSGWGMSGNITVTNPNAWPVTVSDVTDHVDVGGGASCVVAKGVDLVIPANADRTFTYTCTFTSRPSYDGTNTATVTWDRTALVSPHTSATGTAAVVAASWKETPVDKTVTVVDDKTDPANPVVLGTAEWAGEGTTKEFTYTGPALKGKKGQCVDYTNNAWLREDTSTRAAAKATVCWPADVTVTKDVRATYDTTYFWDITKDVDRSSAQVGPGDTAPFTYTVVASPNGSQDHDWAMSGTITVSNPNTYKPVTVGLSDSFDGGGVCTTDSASVEVPAATMSGGVVTPGTAKVAYSCAFPDGRPAYTGTDTVTASWDGHEATGTADVSFVRAGRTDYQVDVLDDLTKPDQDPTVLGTVRWDDPADKRTFTTTLDLGAQPGQCMDHTNTARVDTTAGDVTALLGAVVEGLDPFAQQTVTVCEKAQPVVSNDATATYDTRYLWDVSKDVDRATAEVGPGQTAPFGYTVVAKPDGSRDSGWTMTGSVTLTNPSTFEDATMTLSDEYDGGGVCALESQTVEVPKGASVEVPYTCTFTDQPAYTGKNTVTATWDGQQLTASAPVRFEQATRTDYRVEVRDDLTEAGTAGSVLGTVSWDDPVDKRTFTSTLQLGAAPGRCVDHTNTAWVVVEGADPSAQQTVTVCETAALVVSKDVTATYDTTYSWGISKQVDRTSAEVGADGTAPFDYTVVAKPDGSQDSGWTMQGTITVTNPNSFEEATVGLKDEYDGGGVCTPRSDTVTVPKGGSVEVPYTCAFTQKPAYTGTNTVTASWDGQEVTATAPVSFEQARRTDYRVDVYDDMTDPTAAPTLLGTVAWDDPAEKRTFTNGLELGAEPGRCVDHTNTAWVQVDGDDPSAQRTVTVCEKAPLGLSKDVTATYDTRYLWDVRKDVDRSYAEVGPGAKARFDYTVVAKPNGSQDSRWTMSGTVTLTNPNVFEAATVSLSDAYDGGGLCTPETSSVEVPAASRTGDTFTPGQATVRYTCAFSAKPGYTGSDTTTASWDGKDYTATTPVTFVRAGRTDYQVDVYDDMTTPGAVPTLLGTVGWDDPLESRTFTSSLDLGASAGQCQDHTNTAWVRVSGDDPSAQQTVRVCEKALLVVSKDVTATYDTTYHWDVTKQVDRSSAEVGAGATAPFTYTVVARPGGSDDSGWTMSGTIALTNPNGYRSASVSVKDVYDGGGVCTPGADTLEVPAGETVKVPYTCDFTEKPSYTGTNTVTATWDGQEYTASTPVTFAQDGRTDYQVEVRDDQTRRDVEPQVLGTVAWDDPVEKRTFTSTLQLGAEPGRCVEHTNTAWVVAEGDDPSAERTVEVCSEAGLVVGQKVDASFDRTYHWSIDKSVDRRDVEVTDHGAARFHYAVKATPDGYTDSAYVMGGTVTVTNPNAYTGGTVTATVTDVPSVGEGAACEVENGDDVVLRPGETKELRYTCSFDTPPDHTGTDTATATWTGPDRKQHTASTGGVPVSFRATGHENRTVTVTDDRTDPSVLGEAEWNADRRPAVFEYDLSWHGAENTCVDYRNTAKLEETGQSDSETVTVCREGGLVATNTADASYDRTYRWDITKTADRDRVTTRKGRTGTVHYTVGVTPAGFTDSGWELTGAVTVTNPNDYEDVTVALSDVPDLGEGATCTFDETGDLVVPAGETRDVGYTCGFEGRPSYGGSNTVVVDWGSGSVSATADAAFEPDREVHRTVTVTDDHVHPAKLGTVTWHARGETTELGYDLEVTGPAGRCETLTNTATIVQTGQQAHADVAVCGRREPHAAPKPKPRPPVELLPETGAPSHAGLWTTVGGLMIAVGAALLVRRRRQES